MEALDKSTRVGYLLSGLVLCGMLLFATAGAAQNLMEPYRGAALTAEQERYLAVVKDNPMNEGIQLMEVDLDALKHGQMLFRPNLLETYLLTKNDRGVNSGSIASWCGTTEVEGHEPGEINMVTDGVEIVGHFVIGNEIYALTHIGGGVHAFYAVNAGMATEQCAEAPVKPDFPAGVNPVEIDKSNPDLVQDEGATAKAAGDCRIRVLVAYTPAAKGEFTNILAQINNLINIANTGYNNSGVNFNIELAMCYETSYVEDGNNAIDLSMFTFTLFPFDQMNEVHSYRSLWRADQCALIVSQGSGIAWLNTGYGSQFSVTATGNFNVFTFHHELGHNALCTHATNQDSQPGSSPYAGWGDKVNGCFRTIMAYGSAPGTDFFGNPITVHGACTGGLFFPPNGPCTRQNIFSQSTGTFACGGNNLPRGNSQHRNRDRLNLSRNTIISHEVSPTNLNLTSDYTFFSQESVHAVANNSVNYNAQLLNEFDLRSGSEGSFRATGSVTLGLGFWARSGTNFTALLENCAPLAPDANGDGYADSGEDNEGMNTDHIMPEPGTNGHVHHLTVHPNPARDVLYINLDLYREEAVTIAIYDLLGKQVSQVRSSTSMPRGLQRIETSMAALPAGIYIVHALLGNEPFVARVVKEN